MNGSTVPSKEYCRPRSSMYIPPCHSPLLPTCVYTYKHFAATYVRTGLPLGRPGQRCQSRCDHVRRAHLGGVRRGAGREEVETWYHQRGQQYDSVRARQDGPYRSERRAGWLEPQPHQVRGVFSGLFWWMGVNGTAQPAFSPRHYSRWLFCAMNVRGVFH